MKLIKTFENFMHNEVERDSFEPLEISHQSTGIDHEPHHEIENTSIDHAPHHEIENYMFFGNLKTIQRLINIMLEMDPMKVDQLLKNGHNWAEDHVTSSTENLEQVADFLMGEMTKHEVQESSAMTYSCNECGKMYEDYEINEDHMCLCGGKLGENLG